MGKARKEGETNYQCGRYYNDSFTLIDSMYLYFAQPNAGGDLKGIQEH